MGPPFFPPARAFAAKNTASSPRRDIYIFSGAPHGNLARRESRRIGGGGLILSPRHVVAAGSCVCYAFLRIRSGGKGSVNDIVIGENGD